MANIGFFAYGWSPQGHLFAVKSGNNTLHILSPENSIRQSFDVPYSSTSRLIWPPNGKYVALLIDHVSNWKLNIYGLNGQQSSYTFEHQGPPDLRSDIQTMFWDDDSRSFVFLETTSKYKAYRVPYYDLKQYFSEKQAAETVLERVTIVGLYDRLYHGPNETPYQPLNLVQQQGDTYSVFILPFRAPKPIRAVSDASNIGKWVLGRRKRAVIWNAAHDVSREDKITVFDLNDYTFKTVSASAGRVTDLAVDENGKWLAYTLRSKTGLAVEIVDTATGQKRRLVDHMQRISKLNIETNRLIFEWQNRQVQGVTVFAPDGKRLAHILLATMPIEYSISPNAQHIAMIFADNGKIRFEIAAVDGTWRKSVLNPLADGLTYDTLHWSPDSKYLGIAYTRMTQLGKRQNKMAAFTATGELKWESAPLAPPTYYDEPEIYAFQWTKCY